MRLLIKPAISESEKIDNLIIVCYIKNCSKIENFKKVHIVNNLDIYKLT